MQSLSSSDLQQYINRIPLVVPFSSPWKENQVGLVFAGNIGSNCTNLVHKATLFLMTKPVSEGWG